MYRDTAIQTPPSYKDGGGAKYLWRFPSWGAFVNTAEKYPPVSGSLSSRSTYFSSNDESFEKVLQYAKTGWPAGQEKARKARAMFQMLVGSKVEQLEWQYDVESSGNLDVARYVDGEPECWLAPDVRTIEGRGSRHVHVVFNCSASGAFQEGAFGGRGALVVALVDALEMAGIRTAVTLVDGFSYYKGESYAVVPVKSFGDTLDLDRVTFAMCHPGVLRRLFFSIQEHMPKPASGPVPSSYGAPADVPDEERGDVYIPAISWGAGVTDATAVEWAREQLKRFGVTVKD